MTTNVPVPAGPYTVSTSLYDVRVRLYLKHYFPLTKNTHFSSLTLQQQIFVLKKNTKRDFKFVDCSSFLNKESSLGKSITPRRVFCGKHDHLIFEKQMNVFFSLKKVLFF